MRLLVVTAGIDRSEAAIFTGLRDAGIEVDLACSPGVPALEYLEKRGLWVCRLLVRNRLDLSAASVLGRLLDERGHDIIYALSNRCLSAALIACRGRKQKVVAYRGTVGHVSRFDPASWLTYLNPRVCRIVCVSGAVRDYLAGAGVREAKLETIYKGHDPDWYRFGPRDVRKEFGLPDCGAVACFVGNIRRVKGVRTLLKAAPLAARECNLLLVGEVRDGAVRRLIRKRRTPGNVFFAGYREDAASIAGACDMFVLPSLAREGLPRALIEAMAQGVAPIVTRVGGMPEVVEDGKSGIVVEAGDHVRMADAMRALAADKDLRERLGRRAKTRVEDNLNIKTTISRLNRLFSGISAGNARAP